MQYSKPLIKMLANCIFRAIRQIFYSPIIPRIQYVLLAGKLLWNQEIYLILYGIQILNILNDLCYINISEVVVFNVGKATIHTVFL